jgi:hypothetical protein
MASIGPALHVRVFGMAELNHLLLACEVFITGANFFGTSQCPQGGRAGRPVDFDHRHSATPK